jgi:hypothetical protein
MEDRINANPRGEDMSRLFPPAAPAARKIAKIYMPATDGGDAGIGARRLEKSCAGI